MRILHRFQKKKNMLNAASLQPPRNYVSIDSMEKIQFDNFAKYHVDGKTVYPLVRRVIYPLNSSNLVDCHHSYVGSLFLFHMDNKDIAHLNSLLFDLVRVKDIRGGMVHYIKEAHYKDESNPQVITLDRKSRFFNRHGEAIDRCDFIDKCRARVSLAVDGLIVIDSYHIYLHVMVHQVKVEEDVDAKITPCSDCIFE